MGTVVRGQRTSYNNTTTPASYDRSPLDFSDKVFNPELDGSGADTESSLFRLLTKLSKGRDVKTRKFQVVDDTLMLRDIHIDSGAICASAHPTPDAADSFTAHSGGGKLLRPGYLLRNQNTDEVYYVTGVAGDVVSVTRDWGHIITGSITTAADDSLQILGAADPEGGDVPDAISNTSDVSYNYCGFHRTAIMASDHDINYELIGGNDWTLQQKKAMIQHRIEINRMLWLSTRYATTDPLTAKPITTTGGVLQHLKGNIFDISSAYSGIISERVMDEFMELAFLNGSSEKWGWCGTHFLSALSSFAKNKLQFNDQKSKSYGMAITEYTANGKRILLVEDKKLFTGYGATSGYTGGTLASKLIVLDMKHLSLVRVKGMGTMLHKDVGGRGVSGKTDEWRSTFGLEMRPGLDSPYNASTAPEQYASPHAILDGFITY